MPITRNLRKTQDHNNKKGHKTKVIMKQKLLCVEITNLLSLIGSYKFRAKFGFHKFVQKSHKFHAMVNMNDICMYSIF
jgi:hypothetical protein